MYKNAATNKVLLKSIDSSFDLKKVFFQKVYFTLQDNLSAISKASYFFLFSSECVFGHFYAR